MSPWDVALNTSLMAGEQVRALAIGEPGYASLWAQTQEIAALLRYHPFLVRSREPYQGWNEASLVIHLLDMEVTAAELLQVLATEDARPKHERSLEWKRATIQGEAGVEYVIIFLKVVPRL